MKPSPPAPKAVPGARPTLASSTSSRPSRRTSGLPVDGKEQIEGPAHRREAHAPGRRRARSQTMSRPCRARASCWREEASPPARAPRHPPAGGRPRRPEVEYWIRFSMIWPSAGGASIQPMRQPVIAQFFENVSTKRMRSPVLANVAEGGRARALVDEAGVDLVGDDPQALAGARGRGRSAGRRGWRSSRSGSRAS